MAPTATTSPFANILISRTTSSSESPSCTTAVPGKYGYVSDPTACNAYYAYKPSLASAFMFAAMFAILVVAHVFQGIYYRKKFTWVIIMGALWECGSFSARAISTRYQQEISLVAISQFLFLLSPLWINAFVYMTLGRLIHYFHPSQRIYGVKAVSLGKYFVWADVFSFVIQASGGSLVGPGQDAKAQSTGLRVYMFGLGLQEIFIFMFLALAIKFQIDMHKAEAEGATHYGRDGWLLQVCSMYAILALITIRIIFRLVEFTHGTKPDSPYLHYEYYIYALDAFPMCMAIFILAVFHPGKVLVGPESEFPKMTKWEKQELKKDNKGKGRAMDDNLNDVPLNNLGRGTQMQGITK